MLRTSSAMGPLLVDSLVSHCQTRRDSGLFAGLLTTKLVDTHLIQVTAELGSLKFVRIKTLVITSYKFLFTSQK